MKMVTIFMISATVGSLIAATEIYGGVQSDKQMVAFVYICASYVLLFICSAYLCTVMLLRSKTIENSTRRTINIREPYQNIHVEQ